MVLCTVKSIGKRKPKSLALFLMGLERGCYHYKECIPMEVHRDGVLVNSLMYEFSSLPAHHREFLCPNPIKPRKELPVKPYYVAHKFYIPLSHTISLINNGVSKDDAIRIAIQKFAYFGKHNRKRNKDFDQIQFVKHINKFLDTPNAILCRKSKRR